MVFHRLGTLLSLAALVLGLSACSVSAVVGDEIEADEVAEEAESALEAKVGTRPEIVCPEDLPAKKGESIRCTLTDPASGTEYGLTATVTSVDDGTSKLGFEVDQTPKD